MGAGLRGWRSISRARTPRSTGTVWSMVRPLCGLSFDKYDITKHPNFKYTADADPKNAFDIEAFLSTRLKPKPSEVYDVYEVDATGDE